MEGAGDVVGAVEPVFRLSKLEGDAAFAYAPSETINPSMVLDTVESAYFSFRRRLRDITHSTTCECNACVRILSLDLKFFIHVRDYVVRRIARSEELTGPDVILVHRLAKGSSGQAIGQTAYAVYTAQTMEQMSVNPSVLGFTPHTESFDDLGEVPVSIQDLTDPAKRVAWQRGTTGVERVTEGSHGTGTVNHCMHGPDVLIEHIADYRPFSYITARYDQAGLFTQMGVTTELEETDGGTRVAMRLERIDDGIWEMIGPASTENYQASIDTLKRMLDQAAAIAAAETD
ncbi:MAG TPA: DUF2652 domain-containing protein [Acidimicrobiia bacterium]|nr:DUF2652 domain-containing protein [Acidimicrobiia bacterium]